MNYQQAMWFAIKHGFEGVEIWSSPIDFWPSVVTHEEINTIKSFAKDYGLALAIHFCYGSNNLADLNQEHLQVCMEQLKETIRLGHSIGAGIVVIHPGTIPDFLPYHKTDHLNPSLAFTSLKKDAVERFKKSLAIIAAFAESKEVIVGLENLGYKETSIQSSHEDLREWVDWVGSPSLQLTLDMGHANLEGGVEKGIKVLGPRIKHIHLNDNNGVTSKHGELGTGTIDWKAHALFLKSFEGMLSLEVRNDADTEGAVLRSKGFMERLLERN